MRASAYFLAGLLVALAAWLFVPSWDTLPKRSRFMWYYPQSPRTPRGLEGWMKNRR